MGWISKKTSMITIAVLQGAYLFGFLNFLGTDVSNTGLKWATVFGLLSIGLLYLVYDTLGTR